MRQAIIISAAKNGHINQCKALCHAMGWQILDTLTLPGTAKYDTLWRRWKIWHEQPKAVASIVRRLAALPPAHLVFSGQASRKIAARIRRPHGSRIFVGIPKGPELLFDYAVCFSHESTVGQQGRSDAFPAARHTLWMKGVPCMPVTSGARGNTTAVLLGGNNNAFTIDDAHLVAQLDYLQSIGGPLSIAFSRRTPAETERKMRQHFAASRFIARADRHGFLELLATADRFAITPDSITMTCECCITGRPVALLEAPAHDTSNSTYRFVSEFLTEGYVASLAEIQSGKSWRSGKAWNETARLAGDLATLLGED